MSSASSSPTSGDVESSASIVSPHGKLDETIPKVTAVGVKGTKEDYLRNIKECRQAMGKERVNKMHLKVILQVTLFISLVMKFVMPCVTSFAQMH